MVRKVFVVLLTFFLYTDSCICEENGHYMTNTGRLLDDLFSKGSYNPWVIPVSREPLNVVHTLRLKRIVGFDPHKLTMTANAMTTMTWTDSRIVWDPSSYGNVKRIWVPAKTIWLPDVRMESGSRSPADDTIAIVHHTGEVYYGSDPALLPLYCSNTNTSHEFECQLKYLSWTYSTDMLDLQITNHSADAYSLMEREDTRWRVMSFTVVRNIKQYACCSYADLVYTLRIRQLNINTSPPSMDEQTGGQCSVIVQNGYTMYLCMILVIFQSSS